MKALGKVGLMIVLTLSLIYALGQAVAQPVLSVSPNSIVFQAEVGSPAAQAQSLRLANLMPATTLTWTLSISPSGNFQPIVTPLRGSGDATAIVQVDTSGIYAAGIYTAYVLIDVETADNSPTTIPIVLEASHSQSAVAQAQAAVQRALPPAQLQFGLAFISSPEAPAGEDRYARAASLGARLNRWPMYWYTIETDPVQRPLVFDWSKQDAAIRADLAHGLEGLPILMFTPPGLGSGTPTEQLASPPQGLYDPIFADGSDVPGPGKLVNAANRWAAFVNTAVNRYKPGGRLAQQLNWPAPQGIRRWEIWNEPDFDHFFRGTPADYARLLKVAYLSAKHADPQAYIILGGLAHFQKPTWFSDVLDIVSADPAAANYHGFMDAVGEHNYAYAWKTFDYLSRDREHLDRHGLTNVDLWLTETGVPVCDDPAPEIAPFCPSYLRATMSEQADYLIQSAAWAAWLKAAGFVWFQFYDDVGNQCPHDAFGLVRNPPHGPCTHRDGSPRAAYTSFLVANTLLSNAVPDGYERRGNQEILAFRRALNTDTRQHLIVMWARTRAPETALITAESPTALLVQADGSSQTITPHNGVYTIPLPGATNYSTPTEDNSAAIGGSPRILIEYSPAAP